MRRFGSSWNRTRVSVSVPDVVVVDVLSLLGDVSWPLVRAIPASIARLKELRVISAVITCLKE